MHPDTPTPEQLFLAFRQGHRAALGDLFDRCAPELLRVATHACGSITVAEDAVQDTFLAALQHAERWDTARPIMPWLIGILANRLRAERARTARAVDPGRLARAAHLPTDLVAMAAELEIELERAIDQLPEAYRASVALHLRHDLSPAEIARATGKPASTVRSQITRGLDLLRALLPAGVASTLVLTLSPSRGLAVVKQVVLAQAASGAPAAISTAAATSHKPLAMAAGGIALAIAVWLVAPWRAPDLPPGTPEVASSSGAVVAARASDDPDADPGRAEVAAPSSGPIARGRIAGRVLDEHGAGIADVTVTAWPAAEITVNEFADLGRTVTQRTDAAGHFTLSDLAEGSWRVTTESPDHAPGLDVVDVTAQRPPDDLDIVVRRGRELRGRVTDDRGQAIPNAWVCVRRSRSLAVGVMRELAPPAAGTRTTELGTFRLAGLVGDVWNLDVRADGHVDALVGGTRADVEIQLVRCARVHLRISTADGRAVAGAQTHLAAPAACDPTSVPPRAVVSGADGVATLADVAPGRHRLHVRAPGLLARASDVRVAPGEDLHLAIALDAGGSLRTRVLDPDGRPLGGVTAFLLRPGSPRGAFAAPAYDGDTASLSLRPTEDRVVARSVTGSDGVATFGGLAAGDYAIDAHAAGLRTDAPRHSTCDGSGARQVDVKLVPTALVAVRAIDQRGRILTGASFTLRGDCAAHTFAAHLQCQSAGELIVRELPAGRYVAILRSASARSLGPGRVSQPIEFETTSVEVTLGPGEQHRLELRMPPTIDFVGEVRDSEGPVAGAIVELGPPADIGGERLRQATTAADGRFVLEGLPPGVYAGVFARSSAGTAHTFSITVAPDRIEGPAILTLPSGSVCVVVLGPNSVLAGARAHVPSMVLRHGGSMVMRPASGDLAALVTRRVPPTEPSDERGQIVLRDIPRGRAQILVEHDDHMPATLDVEVGAGATTVIAQLAPAGRLVVQVFDGEGRAAPAAQIQIERFASPSPQEIDTPLGRIQIPNLLTPDWLGVHHGFVTAGANAILGLAPGHYRARATPADGGAGASDDHEFDVLAAQSAEITLRLRR